jgi:hypothetical protein
MPLEALWPNWDGSQRFNLMQAVRSPNWYQTADPRLDKTAQDCWVTLFHKLNVGTNESWLTRIDAAGGDAAGAWKRIKQRLDTVTFDSGLKKLRNGYWFLEADRRIDHHARTEPGAVLRGECHDGQSEVSDAVLAEPNYDGFVAPYRDFHTQLNVKWYVPGSGADIFFDFATVGLKVLYDGVDVVTRNQHRHTFKTPYRDGGDDLGVKSGYTQVCWGPDKGTLSNPSLPGFMSNAIGRDAIAWLAFVLTNYANDFGYKISPPATSTYHTAGVCHDAWRVVWETANTLLKAAPGKN